MNCYLHIGQTKTGSSYLQSSFALSDLEQSGISYPIEENIKSLARLGRITSGNYWPDTGALDSISDSFYEAKKYSVLISSEAIFGVLASKREYFIERILEKFGNAQIKVLLFVRDPIEHAVSHYQQKVKRGGFSGSLADSFSSYFAQKQTLVVLDVLRKTGCDTTVYNYSRRKSEVVKLAESWLGLEAGALRMPKAKRVNRSLTNSELEFQRLFNKEMEGASRFISDPLCNELPDVNSEYPPLRETDLKPFLERMRDECAAINAHPDVPDQEALWVGDLSDYASRFPNPTDELKFSLSSEQIKVITRAISKELKLRDNFS